MATLPLQLTTSSDYFFLTTAVSVQVAWVLTKMKVAEVLSDLTSLRVCDHHAALALVNSHQATSDTSPTHQHDPTVTNTVDSKKDKDLQRAKELVELHHEVKSRHANGQVDDALQQARTDVHEVLRQLS